MRSFSVDGFLRSVNAAQRVEYMSSIVFFTTPAHLLSVETPLPLSQVPAPVLNPWRLFCQQFTQIAKQREHFMCTTKCMKCTANSNPPTISPGCSNQPNVGPFLAPRCKQLKGTELTSGFTTRITLPTCTGNMGLMLPHRWLSANESKMFPSL